MARYGKDVVTVAGGEINTDRYGLSTGTKRFMVKPAAWGIYPNLGSIHPDAPFCSMEKRRVIMKPGLWLVEGSYAGVENDVSPKVYELQRNTNQEPIETHPDFVEKIGGKPSAPLNGATFVDDTGFPTSDDKLGVFEGFRILLADGDKNKFAGTESYLAPTNTTWQARWTQKVRPDPGTTVGKIDDSVPGSPPDYGEGFSWVYTGMSFEDRGSAVSVRQSWLLGMALPEIYGTE
jgi:hypothetical protein